MTSYEYTKKAEAAVAYRTGQSIAEAQVYATLALAAATQEQTTLLDRLDDSFRGFFAHPIQVAQVTQR